MAFGLAGNILQFIDSGTKFLLFAKSLYRGSDYAHDDLLKLTQNLDAILPKLNCSGNDGDVEESDGSAEKSMSHLALACGKTASQLLGILQNVKTAVITRKRDAVKAALRLTCKEDEIKSLQDRLSSFRSQLNLHLLLSLR